MTDKISVDVGYDTTLGHVKFRYNTTSNQEGWDCTIAIAEMLARQEIDYMVISFQCNQCIIHLFDEEAFTFVKMAFANFSTAEEEAKHLEKQLTTLKDLKEISAKKEIYKQLGSVKYRPNSKKKSWWTW